MSLKPLPIGVDLFETIITQDYYYVDKTLLIRELTEKKGMVNLFTRPRRFGKTLTLSMLKCFFENTGDEAENEKIKGLFSGLKIMEEKAVCTEHMGRYPVIFLTLKSSKQPDFALAYHALAECIAEEYKRHRRIVSRLPEEDRDKYMRIVKMQGSREDFNTSLKFLCKCLETAYHQKTVVLIDEYDVPLENAYFAGFYAEMVDFFRSVFESVCKTNPFLEFAVITGCLRISKESIFTGLNNLKSNSILSDLYSEYFGFTEKEVRETLRYYGRESGFETIRQWYDGYLFGEVSVYNPWSVINHVDKIYAASAAFPLPYWANTSSNSIVRKLIEQADISVRAEIETLMDGGTLTKPVYEEITYEDIDRSEDNLWNFLFFTGYLKKVSTQLVKERLYVTVALPNAEVRYIYRNIILEWFDAKMKTADLTQLFTALLSGDGETLGQELTKQLMDSISYMDSKEDFYHGFLAGVLRGLKGYLVKSNREGGLGRSDLLIRSYDVTKPPVLIEIKVSQTFKEMEQDCQKALVQIDEKHYDAELSGEGYTAVLHCGIAFFRKQCRGQFYYKKL